MDATFKGETVPQRVQFWGNTEPNRPAFIFWGPSGRFVLSRGDVLDLSSRFAYRLTQHGVKPGDVVSIALLNGPERVVVDFGIQLAGAIPMNGQILRADGLDLIESLKRTHAKVLVVDPELSKGTWNLCQEWIQPTKIFDHYAYVESNAIPTLSIVEFCATHKPEKEFIMSLIKEDKCTVFTAHPSDTAYIFTTSGSSGFSKMISHSHKSLLASGFAVSFHIDSLCSCAPLGWIGGFPRIFLTQGCTRYLLDDSNGEIPDRLHLLWKMMETEKVQLAALAPIQYLSIYSQRDMWESSDFKLQGIVFAGQPMKKENLKIIGQLTDSVICAYGSTEYYNVTRMIINADNIDSFEDNLVGIPIQGAKIRVVNADLQDVELGEIGEILACSNSVCQKIDGESSSNFMTGGLFRTGDLGYMRKDGCLLVIGRKSDAIMHGQYILYPYWLEDKLIKCPGVKQVVIVPVPDPVLHQEICVCVQPEEGADLTTKKIIDFCKSEIETNVPSSMKFVPKYAVTFETFPLTKTLKLDRKAIISTAREKLKL